MTVFFRGFDDVFANLLKGERIRLSPPSSKELLICKEKKMALNICLVRDNSYDKTHFSLSQ